MALVLKDRVRETSTTTGTGTLTLAGAVAGFQSFSAIGTGNTTYYTIATSSDWEVGIGTWTSPNQLSRGTILASTNGGAAVNFGAGTKDVFVTLPSERAVYTDAAGNLSAPPAIGGTTPNTINATYISANGNYQATGENGFYYLISYVDVGATGTVKMNLAPGESYKRLALYGSSDSGDNFNNEGVDFPYGLRTSTLSAYPGSSLQLSSTTLTVSGPVSGTGFINYFAAPPAIGGTTPNTITGTTVTAKTEIDLPAVVNTGVTTGVIRMVDGGDGYDYLNIWTDDGAGQYPVIFPGGAIIFGSLGVGDIGANYGFFTGVFGSYSGYIKLRGSAGYQDLTIQAPASFTSYTLTLPSTAGSANQVLTTSGAGGVLSWTSVQKTITSGTAAPSGGSDGDIYLQYV